MRSHFLTKCICLHPKWGFQRGQFSESGEISKTLSHLHINSMTGADDLWMLFSQDCLLCDGRRGRLSKGRRFGHLRADICTFAKLHDLRIMVAAPRLSIRRGHNFARYFAFLPFQKVTRFTTHTHVRTYIRAFFLTHPSQVLLFAFVAE